MAANLKARVARLESRPGTGLRNIFIFGGLEDDATNERASAGEMTWSRDDGEAPEDFHARVEDECRAMGARDVVFGGLPY